jgi:hypothetical protein
MREFLGAAAGIVALVLAIIAVAFLGTGAVLAVALAPAAIGLTFLAVGAGFSAVAVALGAIRARAVLRRTRLRQTGLEARGTIDELRQNFGVRVNQRSPWVVGYSYEAQGRRYQGSESVWDLPTEYVRGASVSVRYDPAAAARSVLALP